MNTFHVVVRHNDTGIFQPIRYGTYNEELTESDLLEIDRSFADTSNGYIEVKTQIISWQKLG